VRKDAIQKEKPLRKATDTVLFNTSLFLGIQGLKNEYYALHDLSTVHKYYQKNRDPLLPGLARNIQKRKLTVLEFMYIFAVQLFTAYQALQRLLSSSFLERLPGIRNLKRGYDAEVRLREQALARFRDRHYHPLSLEEFRAAQRPETVCPMCHDDVFTETPVLHCKTSEGFLAPNAPPQHRTCLENWRLARSNTLGTNVPLEDLECPGCRQRMGGSENDFLQSAQGYPTPSFPRYALNRLMNQPLLRPSGPLSRVMSGGYEALAQQESEGLELTAHPHND